MKRTGGCESPGDEAVEHWAEIVLTRSVGVSTMIRCCLLSAKSRSSSILPRQALKLRLFSDITNTTGQSKDEEVVPTGENGIFLDPDWYRDPKESDGPRCIKPDYPDVPFTSYQNRDPYQKFTDQQRRRNFGEPVNEQFDILTTQSFDVESTYSMRYMLTGVAIAGATFYGAIQLLNMVDDKDGWRRDVAAREFPYLEKYQPVRQSIQQ